MYRGNVRGERTYNGSVYAKAAGMVYNEGYTYECETSEAILLQEEALHVCGLSRVRQPSVNDE